MKLGTAGNCRNALDKTNVQLGKRKVLVLVWLCLSANERKILPYVKFQVHFPYHKNLQNILKCLTKVLRL